MDKVLRFLADNRIMTLATSADDVPRASILEYTLVGDPPKRPVMMFSTSPDSIKSKNLDKNPNISFTVGHIPAYLAANGTAREATAEEKEEYIQAQMGVKWGALRSTKPKYVEDWNEIMMERHPEFKKTMKCGQLKYYTIKIDTVHYTEGFEPVSEKIEMKK
ncbi:MAG: pyridoxamine 5'-phosphate oxidase family protein [Methanomassiliicoccaceae archaeon]|nr:pyridoxamine 5'-phosphate oxidase family protein [Methanomassiliicoccaceae archaeon]